MEKLYKKAFKLSSGCIFVNSDDPKYMMNKNIIEQKKVNIIKSVGVDTSKFNIDNYSLENLDNKDYLYLRATRLRLSSFKPITQSRLTLDIEEQKTTRSLLLCRSRPWRIS